MPLHRRWIAPLTVSVFALILSALACGPLPAAPVPGAATPTPTGFVPCPSPVCQPGEVIVCPPGDCTGGCGVICATPTFQPVCTPPPCRPGEVYYCPGECPGGCGTTCATPTPSTASGLSAEGPWLVYWTHSPDGIHSSLWAVNSDSSAVVPLVLDEIIVAPRRLGIGVSASGGHVAFITASDQGYHDLTLHLITLPGIERQVITPLTSPATEPGPGLLVDDPNFEVVRAITDVDSLAWSADGTRLAFVGAMAGPTADVYVYSLADGSITQLSDGPSQAIKPNWSPDGRYVVHFGVSTLGTGAGYGMEGAWAAAADGSEVLDLYDPDSGDEEVFAWTGDDTFLVASWNPQCGLSDLRTLTISTGQGALRWDRCFSDVATNPDDGTLVIAVDDLGGIDPQGGPGVWRVNLGELGAVQLDDTPAYQAEYSPELGTFFVRTWDEGVLAFDRQGQPVPVPDLDAGLPAIAPLGVAWAWPGAFWDASVGLWLGPTNDLNPAQIFDQSVTAATWSPEDFYLFIFGGSSLYVVDWARSNFTPFLLQENVFLPGPEGFAWARP